ncbi:MAG: capsular polysaccharide biosynthesis protein CapF [Kiritimatiellae bacterium]|jgi:UDP-2-acetamido-2,6-beta-L-arabino-hexul-4-ose reductase|nr:capsular polysaccharide biosynthesis protein CapF [Kiritimatiellia bacterium]
MNILITGAKGFVGKNLVCELKNQNLYHKQANPDVGELYKIFEYDIDSTEEELQEYTNCCDFVFHLAGVNRPKTEEEFMEGNFGFTSELLYLLKKNNNKSPILITSSIQAELDNPYGKSKKAGEDLILSYGEEVGCSVYVYRLPNLFGKWCRPNYNSAVATFCNNIANDLSIQVNDPTVVLTLAYIDDVLNEFVNALKDNANRIGQFCEIPTVHRVELGRVVDLLNSFRESREDLSIPNMSDGFTKKLYSTYLSYLSSNDFSYELDMNVDDRGSFTEFIRTADRGQVSVNISKPGITKGNHWHHTKNEKFLVVKGTGVIRFRHVQSEEIVEYFVNGDKPEVVDIPTGYTHNIENIGDDDMVTVIWVNECFDPEKPDTYYESV